MPLRLRDAFGVGHCVGRGKDAGLDAGVGSGEDAMTIVSGNAGLGCRGGLGLVIGFGSRLAYLNNQGAGSLQCLRLEFGEGGPAQWRRPTRRACMGLQWPHSQHVHSGSQVEPGMYDTNGKRGVTLR